MLNRKLNIDQYESERGAVMTVIVW